MVFRDFLYIKLNQIREDLDFNDYKISVYDEQEFINKGADESEISIVLKKTSSTRTFEFLQYNYQLLAVAEENNLEVASAILTKLSQDYNYFTYKESDTLYKMSFNNPVVMQSFAILGNGYRNVLYVYCWYIELGNCVEISDLYIDGTKYVPLAATINYGAELSTFQFRNKELADSIKSAGALVISLTMTSISNDLVLNTLKIAMGDTTVSGNKEFNFTFKIGSIQVNNLKMKLSSLSQTTATYDMPALQIIFNH